MDNYDLVLEYLLGEGYSHKEATRIMVDENWLQNLGDNIKNVVSGVVNTAKKRTSSLPNILRAGAADSAAVALSTTPANAVKPALPPQAASIVRTVAAPVTSNPLQQVAAPVKKVIDIVRQSKGKPGGPLGSVVNTQVVKPNVNTGNLASANPKGSSVSTGSGGGVTTTSGGGVTKPTSRTPGGPLEKAGPVVDVQSRLPGTPSVQRISPSKVRNFKPSVKVTSPTKVTPTRAGGSPISAVVTALLDLQGDTPQTRTPAQTAERERRIQARWGDAMNKTPSRFDKAGPDVPKTMANIPPAEAQPGSPSYVAPTQSRPSVNQVVTKKKVVTPVVKKPAPEKPVDPRLQKYLELVQQGRHGTARDLGRQIHADKFGIPTTPTRKTA